jgi:limonene-1,2-epoxide hydrolase
MRRGERRGRLDWARLDTVGTTWRVLGTLPARREGLEVGGVPVVGLGLAVLGSPFRRCAVSPFCAAAASPSPALGPRPKECIVIEFEPEKTWLAVEARMEAETNPRIRSNLEEVRNHMRAEIRGEHGPLMATLTKDPLYHMWGLPEESGPKGRDAVSAFYANMIETGGNRFHFDVRRICADEGSVVTEGVMRSLFAGAVLEAMGIDEVEGEPVDAAGEYVSEWQILTVWPIDEAGKIIGEDIYFGSAPMKTIGKRAP